MVMVRNVLTLKWEFREGLSEVIFDQRPRRGRKEARWITEERAVWEEATARVRALGQKCTWYII